MERGKIGFVVGLAAEAALLKGRGFAVGIGGGTSEGAAVAAWRLAAEGVTALISFGLAGGLDSQFRPGALVVPRAVLADGVVYACDAELLAWFGGATAELMFAGNGVAATIAEKSALFAQTAAAAVDLESGAVAQAARERGRRFAVLRAVVDAADFTLPPAALMALGPTGRIGPVRILNSVLRQPAQIPGLLRLGRDATRARRMLSQAVAAL